MCAHLYYKIFHALISILWIILYSITMRLIFYYNIKTNMQSLYIARYRAILKYTFLVIYRAKRDISIRDV